MINYFFAVLCAVSQFEFRTFLASPGEGGQVR